MRGNHVSEPQATRPPSALETVEVVVWWCWCRNYGPLPIDGKVVAAEHVEDGPDAAACWEGPGLSASPVCRVSRSGTPTLAESASGSGAKEAGRTSLEYVILVCTWVCSPLSSALYSPQFLGPRNSSPHVRARRIRPSLCRVRPNQRACHKPQPPSSQDYVEAAGRIRLEPSDASLDLRIAHTWRPRSSDLRRVVRQSRAIPNGAGVHTRVRAPMSSPWWT